MNKLLVHISVITIRHNTYISIPCTHGPACSVVGIQRNCICVVLDSLKCCDKLIRRLGKFCNACCLKYSFVIENTLCVSHVGNTIAGSIELPCIRKVNFLRKIIKRVDRLEVCAKISLIYCRDKHDVTPITCRKTKQRIFSIVCNTFSCYCDVGIYFVELCNHLCNCTVFLTVCLVMNPLNISCKICVILTYSNL